MTHLVISRYTGLQLNTLERIVGLSWCLCLALLTSAALADPFPPRTIKLSRVRTHLNRPGPGHSFDWQFERIAPVAEGPGLFIAGRTLAVHARAVRKFSDLVHEKYGYSLVLATKLDDFTTPVFSGLVLDREQKPIANFKLISHYENHAALLKRIDASAEKIERYSADRDSFTHLAYKNLLELAGYDREADVPWVEILSPEGLAQYQKLIRDVTRAVALFEPGRPTWIFGELLRTKSFTAGELESLGGLTRDSRVLTHIFVHSDAHLFTSRGGATVRQLRETCEIELE